MRDILPKSLKPRLVGINRRLGPALFSDTYWIWIDDITMHGKIDKVKGGLNSKSSSLKALLAVDLVNPMYGRWSRNTAVLPTP